MPVALRKGQWTRVRRKLLSDTECGGLVNWAAKQNRYIRSNGRQVDRNVEICYLYPSAAPSIFAKIARTFVEENIWGLALTTMIDPIRVLRYTRGSYSGQHTDFDYATADHSKITAIIPLVRRHAWRGGHIRIGNPRVSPSLDKGDCLLFPSFAMHEVTPVTAGTRIVLAAWVVGPPLR